MNEDSNIPNQPDWEKLIAFLEQEHQDESQLSAEESAQLVELKKIIISTGAALNSHSQFDSKAKWNTVKDRLILNRYTAEQTLSEAEQPSKKNSPIPLWAKILVAAAAVAVVILGIQLFRTDTKTNQNTEESYAAIQPGRNGASITLANGKVIQLSGSKTGVIVGADLTYSDGSALSANQGSLATGESNKVQMLTAQTAKGQTYEFILPDGTHVYLNADSKIIFPSQFIEQNRKIMVKGEAYFEVAKDKKHPFIVSSSNQEVEVLGTAFNINSYEDESSTKTTLLEGSIKLSATDRQTEGKEIKEPIGVKVLKPNEQGTISNAGQITVTKVNANEAIAWKNGKFIFEEENIESVMRKLARWYNVEVIYEGDFSHTNFVGSISRSDNISKILDKITFTQAVKFKIEGRRIYVTK